MSVSTKVILNTLISLPLTDSQRRKSFAKHHSDREDSHSGNNTTTSKVTEDGRTEDVLQLKIKDPKLTPAIKNHLTSKEHQLLMKEFILAKHMLDQFKEALRQKGFDVTNYFVSVHNGRISYHIPNKEHYHLFMTNRNKFAKQIDIQEAEPSRRRGLKM